MSSIEKILNKKNPTDIANVIVRFDENDICDILSALTVEDSGEIILELPEDIRSNVLTKLDNKAILNFIEEYNSKYNLNRMNNKRMEELTDNIYKLNINKKIDYTQLKIDNININYISLMDKLNILCECKNYIKRGYTSEDGHYLQLTKTRYKKFP